MKAESVKPLVVREDDWLPSPGAQGEGMAAWAEQHGLKVSPKAGKTSFRFISLCRARWTSSERPRHPVRATVRWPWRRSSLANC